VMLHWSCSMYCSMYNGCAAVYTVDTGEQRWKGAELALLPAAAYSRAYGRQGQLGHVICGCVNNPLPSGSCWNDADAHKNA
jgi:hypothetical protein